MREATQALLWVVVATPLGKGGEGGIDRMMDGVRASGLVEQHKNLRLTFGTTRGRGSIWLSPLYLASFILRTVWLRLIGRCDLIHINLASEGSTYRKTLVARTARALGIPYLLHLHGADFQEFYSSAKPALRKSINLMFTAASRVIVLGEIWRKFVIEALPVRPDQVAIIPNAVAIPRQRQVTGRTGEVRILFLGRIGARKGVPTLLEALSKIQRQTEWTAVIAGDGEIAETRSKLESLNLSSRVNLPGWLNSEDTEYLLAHADILVLPSRQENLPMSVIEAMAAGLTVITTPVGATSEIIKHDVTGLLVPVDDVACLANALSLAVSDPKLRRRLGQAAQHFHQKNLEIGGYTRRLLELWRDVAA